MFSPCFSLSFCSSSFSSASLPFFTTQHPTQHPTPETPPQGGDEPPKGVGGSEPAPKEEGTGGREELPQKGRGEEKGGVNHRHTRAHMCSSVCARGRACVHVVVFVFVSVCVCVSGSVSAVVTVYYVVCVF